MAKKKLAKRQGKVGRSPTKVATVASEATNGEVSVDGTLTLSNGENIDAIVTRLIAQGLEAKHKLDTTEGLMRPTTAFLIELGQSLKLTPTLAYEAWIKACTYFAESQKKTNSKRS